MNICEKCHKNAEIFFPKQEVNLYKKNAEIKFGRLVTSLASVRFNRNGFGDQLKKMFPDYDGSSKFTAPKSAPAQTTPINPTPLKSTPSQSTPSKYTPSKSEPSESIPSESTRSKSISSKSIRPNADTFIEIPEKRPRIPNDIQSDSKKDQKGYFDFKRHVAFKPAQFSSSFACNDDVVQKFEEKSNIITTNMLSLLETNVRQLIGECKTPIQALNAQLSASKTAHIKEISELNATIAKLKLLLEAAKILEANQTDSKAPNEIAALKENHAKEISTLKDTHNRATADANKRIETLKETLKKQEIDLQKVKKDLVEEHKLLVAELQEKHRLNENMEINGKNNQQKLIEMEKKIQATVQEKDELKAQLESKYLGILTELKKGERARIHEDLKGKLLCICGKVVPGVFCSKECTVMWYE